MVVAVSICNEIPLIVGSVRTSVGKVIRAKKDNVFVSVLSNRPSVMGSVSICVSMNAIVARVATLVLQGRAVSQSDVNTLVQPDRPRVARCVLIQTPTRNIAGSVETPVRGVSCAKRGAVAVPKGILGATVCVKMSNVIPAIVVVADNNVGKMLRFVSPRSVYTPVLRPKLIVMVGVPILTMTSSTVESAA